MHEYSLVEALFEQIEASVRAHRATAVRRVKVRIGELAGVEIDLLRTAYDLLREQTLCSRAPLDVETVSARWECPGGHGEIPRGNALVCPVCSRPARLAAGDDIVLEQLEVEVP